MTVLKNGGVFYNGECQQLDVRFEETIQDISVNLDPASGENTVDCTGKLVLPGGVDPHVHFRDFAQQEKETWQTGAAAAVAGSTTTVGEMPNTTPPATTSDVIEQKREKAVETPVNAFIYGGVETNRLDDLRALTEHVPALKLYMASSTGSLCVDDPADQYRVMQVAAETDTPVVVHAETGELFREPGEPYRHADVRPAVAEAAGVARAVALAADTGAPLHVAHVTSKQGVDTVRAAKQQGVDVTAEVCPQHLLFTEEDVADGYLKVNPPIRSEEDKAALRDGLHDGTIDIVASDHAPHLPQEKEQGIAAAPSGVPGVQERYPFMVSAALSEKVPLERVVDACCRRPAERFRYEQKGQIVEGYDADIAVFNKSGWNSGEADVTSKCGWSAYADYPFQVQPAMTFVGGERVY